MKFWLIMVLLCCVAQPLQASSPLDELTFITEIYPPYSFVEEGRPRGISVELLTEILRAARSRQTRDDIQVLPWSEGYQRALTEPNTVLFSTARTAEREHLFQWAGPIAPTRTVLLAQRQRGIRLQDFAQIAQQDLQIAAVKNSAGHQLLLREGLEAGHIHAVDNGRAAAQLLHDGTVDLWVTEELVGRWLFDDMGFGSRTVQAIFVLRETPMYFAIHLDTPRDHVYLLQDTLDHIEATRQ